MQKIFFNLSFFIKLCYIAAIFGNLHLLKGASHDKSIFEHENFTLQAYVEKASKTQSFTYILELLELGETPKIVLELGNKPFKDIVVTGERITHETFVELPESYVNASSLASQLPHPPQVYTLTTFSLEGIPRHGETHLTLDPWEIFALLGNEVFPITLKAQTLKWENIPLHSDNSLFSRLSTHPYYRNILIAGIVLLIAIGTSIIFFLKYRKRLKNHRYFKEMAWETIRFRYKEQKVEDLYYQFNKTHYFETLKEIVDETTQRIEHSYPITGSLIQEMTSIRERLAEIVNKMTETHNKHPNLVKSYFTWVKQTFF